MQISLTVNQETVEAEVEGPLTLLDLLRERLGLTGTKRVCDEGGCGQCTVLLDQKPVYACILLAASCRGREVETVEGLAGEGGLHPLQRALIERQALACGFCAPAWLMAVKGLFEAEPGASVAGVRQALAGILCRCGADPSEALAAPLPDPEPQA